MKKSIRLTLRIKNCKEIFREGLGPGTIAKVDLIWDLDPSAYRSPQFIRALLDHETKLIKQFIEVDMEDIE